jgi:hypothetical protein
MNNQLLGQMILKVCHPEILKKGYYYNDKEIVDITDELRIILLPYKKQFKLIKNGEQVHLKQLNDYEKDTLLFTLDELLLLSI